MEQVEFPSYHDTIDCSGVRPPPVTYAEQSTITAEGAEGSIERQSIDATT